MRQEKYHQLKINSNSILNLMPSIISFIILFNYFQLLFHILNCLFILNTNRCDQIMSSVKNMLLVQDLMIWHLKEQIIQNFVKQLQAVDQFQMLKLNMQYFMVYLILDTYYNYFIILVYQIQKMNSIN
ncbi:unnamed protein product [Paramecium sonneborni]|uniref:Transmembrane protein n=1 Tax=Paramecium sonneborni TaxID=65129 RepID=A0A8S1KE52_9CILI|nr:unnamed protein product [Paramecium sonneborni]